jgi:CubicO group peptidase (beta-lactamase class C family)
MNVETIVDKDFNGVISVKKDNHIIIQRAYGYSDITNKIPNETDTNFATASAGKVFVAICILQLIERGKLNMADTIGSIEPGKKADIAVLAYPDYRFLVYHTAKNIVTMVIKNGKVCYPTG